MLYKALCRTLRHYSETFGTPGFFGIEFYYQPENGHAYTKQCPAPVTPKYLIKELSAHEKHHKEEIAFKKQTHSLLVGWLASQTIGFLSAIKLVKSIFKPESNETSVSAFKHMSPTSVLTFENKGENAENGLKIGFTIQEMAERVYNVLKSIGLIQNFSSIIYLVGHGSSTVNNPHYAAYDCGACAGRPGSVNARVFALMANKQEVRNALLQKGINIPTETQFLGALHDTTNDEVFFYDENLLSETNKIQHLKNIVTFNKALNFNAKERANKFFFIDLNKDEKQIHEIIKKRSVTLFEPRPEFTHINNALCIIGNRAISKNIFFDRRAFLNSYNFHQDPSGEQLFNIMKAATPVCGGINLQYYFSRVDNLKLGAGSKLPHNVMGLFGVANGIEGDLRAGLPQQMIEIHEPLRIMFIIEQLPEIVLYTLKKDKNVWEWYKNEWVNLTVINPENNKFYRLLNNQFVEYQHLSYQFETFNTVYEIANKHNNKQMVSLIH
jgi:uncharacterized protein